MTLDCWDYPDTPESRAAHAELTRLDAIFAFDAAKAETMNAAMDLVFGPLDAIAK